MTGSFNLCEDVEGDEGKGVEGVDGEGVEIDEGVDGDKDDNDSDGDRECCEFRILIDLDGLGVLSPFCALGLDALGLGVDALGVSGLCALGMGALGLGALILGAFCALRLDALGGFSCALDALVASIGS